MCGFVNGEETGGTAAGDARSFQSADVFPPDIEHSLRDLVTVFPVSISLESLRLFSGAAHADMDLFGRFRDQAGGTVSDKESIAVHPGDIIGFGLEHHKSFAAGEGAAEIIEREEPDLSELFQDRFAFGIEAFGSDDHGFIHAILTQGGDHQKDPPEIIAVARSCNRIILHAFSLIGTEFCGIAAASLSSR